MILGATDQKLWLFEVLKRSLDRVGANQQELTTSTKRGGQEENNLEKKGTESTGPGVKQSATRGCRPGVGGPGPAGDQWSPAGYKSTHGPMDSVSFFSKFLF
jgi:hypothetical protein